MGEVVRFVPRPQVRLVSTNADDLRIPVNGCPTCTGRGAFPFNDGGYLAFAPCPCGGDDENRIDRDGPDFDGAA